MELLEFMEQGLTSVRSDALILPDWEEPPEVYNTLIHLAHSAGMKVLQVESGNSFFVWEKPVFIFWLLQKTLWEKM